MNKKVKMFESLIMSENLKRKYVNNIKNELIDNYLYDILDNFQTTNHDDFINIGNTHYVTVDSDGNPIWSSEYQIHYGNILINPNEISDFIKIFKETQEIIKFQTGHDLSIFRVSVYSNGDNFGHHFQEYDIAKLKKRINKILSDFPKTFFKIKLKVTG
jgi:hypothetical protein